MTDLYQMGVAHGASEERERIAQELRIWAACYEPGYGSDPVTFIAALADKLEGKDTDD